jgi:hypothetical protein
VADGKSGLRVVDISNPLSPKGVGSFDTPGFAKGVAVSENYIYVADQGSGLWIFSFTPTSITLEQEDKIAKALNIYPNPLSRNLIIPTPQETAKVRIYNILGQVVKEVIVSSPQAQHWDGRDATGRNVPTGLYFYELIGKQGISQKGKLLMVR